MSQPVLNGHFAKLSSGLVVPQKEAMKYEALRVASFQTFPKSVPQSALKLANAGFYYVGKNDEVECFDCMLKLKDWGPNDDPFEVHKRYSVECPYINNNDPDNVPLASRGVNEDSVKAAKTQFGRLSTNNSPKERAHASMAQGDISKESDPKSSTPVNSASNPKSDAAQELKVKKKNVPLASKGVNGDSVQAAATQYSRLPTNNGPKETAYASMAHADVSKESATQQTSTSTEGAAQNFSSTTSSSTSNENCKAAATANSYEYQKQQNFHKANHNLPPNNGSTLFPQSRDSQPQLETRHDYRYERSRLASFQNWPSNAAVRPEDLAKSGFYYTGTDDRVQCTFCRGILRNWEPSDQADAEHRRHFGQCPFLVSPYGVGNVEIGDEYKIHNKNDPDFQDYCQSIVTEKPVHQRYSLPADRLGTFKDFPSNMTQTPEQFARSGFYYSGIADQVKCFFCDGGLRNWEPNDDPWTEHARWFPRCGYLRLCKGDEFIKEVQGRYAPPSQNQRPARLRNAANLPKHPVDTKKVLEHLKSRIVTSVMEMGYDKEKVKIVIRRRMEDLGNDFFPNAESLLDAILEYEEELKYTEVYGHEEEENDDQSEDKEPVTADKNTNSAEPKKKNKKKKNKKKKNTSDANNVLGITEPLTHLDEDEATALAEDVQRLKDERTCKVCMDEEVNVVFLKCGHLVCCSNCAPALRHCPICRETIRGTVRVFLS